MKFSTTNDFVDLPEPSNLIYQVIENITNKYSATVYYIQNFKTTNYFVYGLILFVILVIHLIPWFLLVATQFYFGCWLLDFLHSRKEKEEWRGFKECYELFMNRDVFIGIYRVYYLKDGDYNMPHVERCILNKVKWRRRVAFLQYLYNWNEMRLTGYCWASPIYCVVVIGE